MDALSEPVEDTVSDKDDDSLRVGLVVRAMEIDDESDKVTVSLEEAPTEADALDEATREAEKLMLIDADFDKVFDFEDDVVGETARERDSDALDVSDSEKVEL